MTTDELNNRARVYLNRVGNDYNAARSLLDGMSEEEKKRFATAVWHSVNGPDDPWPLAILKLTPAQLCEAWLKATEGRAGAGSRKEEA